MLRLWRKTADGTDQQALPPVVEVRHLSPHLLRDLNLREVEDFLSLESIRDRKLPQNRLF
ncbi:hypothetical protein GCM10011611_43820 [Aliidongia dinghuensis]|uniref:Uncharacterized protein n=1 Tax=Aliidongia dinghuensis TaxID=1867774 RepID=A0A8J3E551_9PROT|nr:hypothetical protein [Aliidongia dinghuensis]GGF32885.1 hypothetical protein GCM10011611_43820 [Aliidongia dinghuensis]